MAVLSASNPRFQLLFRGQKKDYKMKEDSEISNLYPSIFRNLPLLADEIKAELNSRYRKLYDADEYLNKQFKDSRLLRNKIVRWAVLQHYEVCPTPLLDITGSIQTALSFAIDENDTGWIYVFGFPQLSGGVSVSIESQTQVIDLSQLCPPHSLRPHFQSGYLVSEYPEIDKPELSHSGLARVSNNFSCRLITKLKLEDCQRWGEQGFTRTPETILYPNNIDFMYPVCNKYI